MSEDSLFDFVGNGRIPDLSFDGPLQDDDLYLNMNLDCVDGLVQSGFGRLSSWDSKHIEDAGEKEWQAFCVEMPDLFDDTLPDPKFKVGAIVRAKWGKHRYKATVVNPFIDGKRYDVQFDIDNAVGTVDEDDLCLYRPRKRKVVETVPMPLTNEAAEVTKEPSYSFTEQQMTVDQDTGEILVVGPEVPVPLATTAVAQAAKEQAETIARECLDETIDTVVASHGDCILCDNPSGCVHTAETEDDGALFSSTSTIGDYPTLYDPMFVVKPEVEDDDVVFIKVEAPYTPPPKGKQGVPYFEAMLRQTKRPRKHYEPFTHPTKASV